MTDSSLVLSQDAAGAFDPWDSASLYIDFYSEDLAKETAKIQLTAWNSTGDPNESFNLGTVSGYLGGWGQGGQTYNYTHDLTAGQLSAFEEWGWGNIKITATATNIFNFNDFGIKKVGMEVNTVPEPSTALLLGAGLLGLVGYNRKRFSKKGR